MDWQREGLYFRGNFERQRQNYGKAFDAFEAAGDYRDSLFMKALVMLEASQPPKIVIEHLFEAYDAGDLAALTWLYVLINQQDDIHPRADEIEEIFEKLRHEKHPTVLGQMGAIQLKGNSYDEALAYFKEAALGGDAYSKQYLGEILSDRAWWSEIYECMRDEKVFNFVGFPFMPKLEPIGEVDLFYKDEQNVAIPEDLFELIKWLFDQGPVESRHHRSCFALYKSTIKVKKLAAIPEYENEIRETFGYKGSIAEDPDLLIVFANDLLQCSRIPDLGLYAFLLDRFGVRDLFDEMVRDVMASESKAQVDATFMQMTSFTYNSEFSFSKAMSQIPLNYSLRGLTEFIEDCEVLNFDYAELKITEILSRAKSGDLDSIEEFTNILEFVDRVKYEFDFLPKKLLENVRIQLIDALKDPTVSELRNYLLAFKPGGQRPYYLDDFELVLSGKGN